MQEILIEYLPAFIRGAIGTLKLTSISWFFGISLGVLISISSNRVGNIVPKLFSGTYFFFSAIPFLVLLMWLHYPAQILLGINVDSFYTAAFALILVNALATATIINNGIEKVEPRYLMIAQYYGVSKKEAVKSILIPIVLRVSIPSILYQQVAIVQMSLFASLISYEELFRISQQINSQIYQPVEIYSLLALFFIAICLPLLLVAKWLENKFDYLLKN